MQPRFLFTDAPLARPGRLLQRAARLAQRLSDPPLKRIGLSTGYLPVLALLEGHQALSQKDLAALTGIEQPSMAQTLARMKRDGLIRIRRDPADRRGTRVSLTPKASARLADAAAVLEDGQRRALAGFDAEETATLTRLLQRLLANLEAATAPPAAPESHDDCPSAGR